MNELSLQYCLEALQFLCVVIMNAWKWIRVTYQHSYNDLLVYGSEDVLKESIIWDEISDTQSCQMF